MAYIPATSHITLLATLQRERLLPIRGEVLVAAGQRVESNDVVARAEARTAHRLVDVARALGVPPARACQYLSRPEGAPVRRGERVASRTAWLGLGWRTVTSPVDGRLIFCDQGQALFAAISLMEVRAGLPGTVLSVNPGRGALIETTGALLEGLWGNAREAFAVMETVGDGPAVVLTADLVDASMRGAILAAGSVADAAALKAAVAVGVRGLVLGSVPAELLPALQALPVAALVVEGLGSAGFSAPAYALLAGNARHEVWLNARPIDRAAGARPEVIIPQPAGPEPPPPPQEGEPVEPGKRVRLLRGPEAGRIGEVVNLSGRPVTLPSGLRAPVAAVALDDRTGLRPTVTVPLANLELLE